MCHVHFFLFVGILRTCNVRIIKWDHQFSHDHKPLISYLFLTKKTHNFKSCHQCRFLFGGWLHFLTLFPTFSARGSPRDLRVFDETVSSMKVSWGPAPGNVLQYRVAYRPSAGGPKKEMSVKGDNTVALLKNLQPGTQYDIFVSARYPSGLGDALEGQGTTLEGKPDSFLLNIWWKIQY